MSKEAPRKCEAESRIKSGEGDVPETVSKLLGYIDSLAIAAGGLYWASELETRRTIPAESQVLFSAATWVQTSLFGNSLPGAPSFDSLFC